MADKDLVSVQQARDLVEAAHRAQAQLARFDQAKIDWVKTLAGALAAVWSEVIPSSMQSGPQAPKCPRQLSGRPARASRR